MSDTTYKARYERLATDERSQFLQRARHNALLTIPSLMPLEGRQSDAHLMEPYQGIGAEGSVHLSSRMLVGMLPAGRPFMRLDLPPEARMKLQGEVPTDIIKGLALAEELVQTEVESAGWRQATLMSLQQLIVAGNVLEHLQPGNTIRVYRLDQYVVRRDYRGLVLELIIMERFDRDAIPAGLKPPAKVTTVTTDTKRSTEVELYTKVELITSGPDHFYRRTQQWGTGEEAGGLAEWPVDKVPYFALRWSATPGEDYGRSKIEEHIADLRSLDLLEKAQLEMAGMASRNFITIAPGANAASIKNRLVRAINGDVLVVDGDAVQLKSFDNSVGFQITAQQVQILRANLARAFLLSSAGQRDAERVTAREIERDVQELEAALGGVFSTLSNEMMEARTRVLMENMKLQGKLPEFEDSDVTPTILTGLEALSRERDVGRAMQAAELTAAFGDQAVDVVKIEKILGRGFIGLGFPDAVRGEQETRQIRQDRMDQQTASQALSRAAPQLAKAAVEQDNGGAE